MYFNWKILIFIFPNYKHFPNEADHKDSPYLVFATIIVQNVVELNSKSLKMQKSSEMQKCANFISTRCRVEIKLHKARLGFQDGPLETGC